MNIKRKYLNLFISFVICFSLFEKAETASIPSNLVDWAMELAFKDQLLLPLEFHFDFLDLIPAPPNKTVQIEIPFLLGSITMGNIAPSLKIKILNDKKYIPRVTLIGGYYNNFAMSFIPKDTGKGELWGYDYGLILTKTVNEGEIEDTSTELFCGFRMLYDEIKFKFNEPLEINENSKIEELNKNGSTNILHLGIMKRKTNYEISAQVGVDVSKSRLFLHVMFGGKLARYGFGIYPDAALFIKPYFSLHFRF